MAAPRAYWKGHIRLALVSFPVRLYPAVTQTERVSLHRIHRETHERVRNKTYVEDEGPVEKDDVVMGYEYDRGKFIPVEDDEIEGLQVESKHTIDLSKFVDQADIDPIYYEKPYYVAPDGVIATEAFVTIRDALKAAGKVALGKIVLSRRERVVAIKPYGDGLLLETLRWPEEVRDAQAYFEDIGDADVDADTVEMAQAIIKSRTGPFEPETFVDRYQAELRALIERKVKGRSTPAVEPNRAPKSNVINLMDALKASLTKGDGDGPPAEAKAKAPAKGRVGAGGDRIGGAGEGGATVEDITARRSSKGSGKAGRQSGKAAPEEKPAEEAPAKAPSRRRRAEASGGKSPTAKSSPEVQDKPAPRKPTKKSA